MAMYDEAVFETGAYEPLLNDGHPEPAKTRKPSPSKKFHTPKPHFPYSTLLQRVLRGWKDLILMNLTSLICVSGFIPNQYGVLRRLMLNSPQVHIQDTMTSTLCPIYHASGPGFDRRVVAAFTGKGTSFEKNHNFSFRPPSTGENGLSGYFGQNLEHFAGELQFDSRRLTWPNGGWPHSGQAIIAERYQWVVNERTGGVKPVDPSGGEGEPKPITYDGIATRSEEFVLGVQGADCPSIFLYAPEAKVIGLAHSGWKPLVRNVVGNTVGAMVALGARRDEISAYIGPGIGDHYTQFHWDDEMEPNVRDVFVQAGREDLLTSPEVRHEMSEYDRKELSLALGNEVTGGTSFKLSYLAAQELERHGLSKEKIIQNGGSTIIDRHPSTRPKTQAPFRYQSYRRERPNHGLGMSVMSLKADSQKGATTSADCGNEE